MENYNSSELLQWGLIERVAFRVKQNELYEGLIKSYPKSSIISAINTTFPKCKIISGDKNSNNKFAIECQQIDFAKLEKMMTTYGWYIVIIQFIDKNKNVISQINKLKTTNIDIPKNCDFIAIKFEAKYDVEIDRKFWPKYLYCIAPKNVKLKIEKNGLVPKSGKNLDNQPERIYFALSKEDLFYDMYPQLKKHNFSYNEGGLLMMLQTDKFPDNVRLFKDINWPNQAYYTIVNIPFNCIIKSIEI